MLDWAEAAGGADGHGRGARVLAAYRTLIGLRRTLPQLTDPRRDRVRAEVDAARRHVRLTRAGEDADVILLVALGAEPLPVPADLTRAELLAGHGDDGPLGPGTVPAAVPAPGFLLLRR